MAADSRRTANRAFSFAVYGDSRSMMYLQYKSDQKEEAVKLMVDMFELVLPEKVSEEILRRDVRLTYDPSTMNWSRSSCRLRPKAKSPP